MENTLKNKVKFFAQYYGQQILCFKGETSSHKYMIVSDNGKTLGLPQQYLELTPLHLISDEDYSLIVKNKVMNPEHISDDVCLDGRIGGIRLSDLNVVDYLRSKGYALPYNGLSVEEQVSRGWVVLKTKI